MNESRFLVALLVAFGIGFGISQWATHAVQEQDHSLHFLANRMLVRSIDSLQRELHWRVPRNIPVERDSIVMIVARVIGVSPQRALAIAYVENIRGDSVVLSSAGVRYMLVFLVCFLLISIGVRRLMLPK